MKKSEESHARNFCTKEKKANRPKDDTEERRRHENSDRIQRNCVLTFLRADFRGSAEVLDGALEELGATPLEMVLSDALSVLQ